MTRRTRRRLRGYAVAAATLIAVTAYASESWSRTPRSTAGCQRMTEAVAQRLFDEWNKVLQQNPDAVVRTYAANAMLLPTLENGPLFGRDAIRGYFVHFLEKHPVGRIDTRAVIRSRCNIGIVAGLYTFTLDGGTGRVDTPARYTYTYVFDVPTFRWLISHHHSSARPQKDVAK